MGSVNPPRHWRRNAKAAKVNGRRVRSNNKREVKTLAEDVCDIEVVGLEPAIRKK
jgi:hypothetical protein